MNRYAQDGHDGTDGDSHRRDAMDEEIRELTTAVPGSTERRELAARAAGLTAERREELETEAAEWDALREAVGAAPALPGALAGRLLAVPDGVSGAWGGEGGGWWGVLRRPVGWREIAGVVVLAAGVWAAVWAWEERGHGVRFLTIEQLETVTQQISDVHRSLPATRPDGGERAQEVEALIASRKWSFKAVAPVAKKGGEAVGEVGGWVRLDCGATEVGGKAALFTRWRTPGGETATLVQFDAGALGLPAEFEVGAFGCAREREKKVEVWGDEELECAWALVMSDAVVGNPFVGR